MADVSTATTLAEIIRLVPGSERTLEAFSLDYCCGGKQPLAEACAELGLDPDQVIARLAEMPTVPTPDWLTMGPAELTDHIESTHHAYLHSELPRLSELTAKVVGVHGGHHPELHQIQSIYEAIRADLEPHLMKEERVLFPMIRELAAASSQPNFHCGSLENPISVMLAEHDATGELLTQLDAATERYQTPADACGSYQALFAGYAQLAADTHLHIHKENEALFPAVVALERAVAVGQ